MNWKNVCCANIHEWDVSVAMQERAIGECESIELGNVIFHYV